MKIVNFLVPQRNIRTKYKFFLVTRNISIIFLLPVIFDIKNECNSLMVNALCYKPGNPGFKSNVCSFLDARNRIASW